MLSIPAISLTSGLSICNILVSVYFPTELSLTCKLVSQSLLEYTTITSFSFDSTSTILFVLTLLSVILLEFIAIA